MLFFRAVGVAPHTWLRATIAPKATREAIAPPVPRLYITGPLLVSVGHPHQTTRHSFVQGSPTGAHLEVETVEIRV